MPDYKYRAILRDGKIVRGKILATNKHLVIEKIKTAKMQPIIVKKMQSKKFDKNKFIKKTPKMYKPTIIKPSANFKSFSLKDLKESNFHPFTTIKTKDIIAFSNNLYILKKANFNNIQALQSLYEGIDNPVFKDIIEDVLIGVESGERLYKVMSNYPKVFPSMYVNFIKVGEESGTLDTALLYARDYIEESVTLNKRIKSAIIPRVLQFIFIMLAMVLGLLIGVPILENVYDMFGSDKPMPPATMFALDVVNWCIARWYLFVIGFIGIAVIFFTYINTPRGRYNWDKMLLTAPIFGNLMNNITVSKFFQAMLLNLRNGMRIQESLDVSKNVTKNYYFLSVIEAGKVNALSGGSW
ncbi:MAG: type II secretion system F family protein, partial [Clostridia bacterium]